MCCWAGAAQQCRWGLTLKGRQGGSSTRHGASCCYDLAHCRAAANRVATRPRSRISRPALTAFHAADSQRGPRLLSGCTRGVQSGAPALLVPRNHAGIIQLAGCAASWSAGAPGVAVLRSSGWSALQIDSSCIAGDSSGGTKRGRGTSRWAAWHEEAKVCVCVCVCEPPFTAWAGPGDPSLGQPEGKQGSHQGPG